MIIELRKSPSGFGMKLFLDKVYKMKSIQMTVTRTTKKLYIVLIMIAAACITGPFISFDSKNHGTQIIRHPVESTKDIIKDTNYVIIFDGGSTGTRIHVFSFLVNQDVKRRKIRLEKENFFYTSPGLSSYYYNATEAASSLDPLISKAVDIVPSSFAKETPIILKATAGLRLISDEIAGEILGNVEQRLKKLPFKVDHGAVSMLEEQDEGLFAWYTVNFLLDKLHKINDSIATLDLGGGSTQITFSTYNLNTLVKSPKYIVQRNIEDELEFIYTHSYLGNGLMSARKSILSQNLSETVGIQTGCLADNDRDWDGGGGGGVCKQEFHVKSPCFRILSNRTYTWEQDQTIFNIGYDDKTGDDSWEQCLKHARTFVDQSNIDKPEELNNRQIYAMSYFYDRMKDIKAIKQESGPVKIRDFFLYAENICNGYIKMKNQSPFLCMDLTYIAVYLHHGLGIQLNKDIMIVKKINGIEISWALGAAINVFENNS